jgi:alcohol dehydrogenase class IV
VLSRVIEWNSDAAGEIYASLYPGDLVQRIDRLAEKAGLPLRMREAGVPEEALPRLAEDAGSQWTGRFNPRAFDAEGALEIYQMAY